MQAIVHRWAYPMLVHWFSDEGGQQIPKELAASGRGLQLHGLWDSAVHDPAPSPAFIDVSSLPIEFGANEDAMKREYRRHGKPSGKIGFLIIKWTVGSVILLS